MKTTKEQVRNADVIYATMGGERWLIYGAECFAEEARPGGAAGPSVLTVEVDSVEQVHEFGWFVYGVKSHG